LAFVVLQVLISLTVKLLMMLWYHILVRWSVFLLVVQSHHTKKKTQLVAAPVAARGVLFGNAHVTPSRYLLDRQHYFS
jgi:hypothetical protein